MEAKAAIGAPRLAPCAKSRLWYNDTTTSNRSKEILNRALSWPPDDQEKIARFVHELEQRRADEDISEEEWEIIETRAARRELASDKDICCGATRYFI